MKRLPCRLTHTMPGPFTAISETPASSKSGRMDAVRLKNAGTIDMSSPPDAFRAGRRTGLLHARTIQTHARIEATPWQWVGEELLAGLSEQLPSVVDGLTPAGRLPTGEEMNRAV